MTIIDLSNSETYTDDIKRFLTDHGETIVRYHQQELDTDAVLKKLTRWQPPRPNPYAADFNAMREQLTEIMASKTIRALHYTRLVDSEVEIILRNGFTAPTVETSCQRLCDRLNHIIAEGRLTRDEADLIIERSPLRDRMQRDVRRGLWMITKAFHPTQSGVKLLVGHWGGEVSYFWIEAHRDPELLKKVQSIGSGRIFEIAVPLSEPDGEQVFGCYSAAQHIVDAFAREKGFQIGDHGFDLSYRSDIPAENILAVHSQGDEKYEAFGNEICRG